MRYVRSAHMALALASGEARSGYAVLDFETGRAMTLGAAPRPDCPVCAGAGVVEPYPEPFGCAAPQEGGAPSCQSGVAP